MRFFGELLMIGFLPFSMQKLHAGGCCQGKQFDLPLSSSYLPSKRSEFKGLRTRSKLFSGDILKFVGDYLELEDTEKMSEMSVYWSKVKIYENFFPNDFGLAVPRKVDTGRLLWEYRIVQKVANLLPISCEAEDRLLAQLYNDKENWSCVVLAWILSNFDLRYDNRWGPGSILMDLMIEALQRLPEHTKWYWSRLAYNWIFRNRFELHQQKYWRSNFLDLMFEVSSHVAVNYVPQGTTLTLVMFAAKIDDTRSMLRLIERGARVNERDGQGWTALHFAAFYGNDECCEILCHWGADIHAKTNGKNGAIPLEYAKSWKAFQILRLY